MSKTSQLESEVAAQQLACKQAASTAAADRHAQLCTIAELQIARDEQQWHLASMLAELAFEQSRNGDQERSCKHLHEHITSAAAVANALQHHCGQSAALAGHGQQSVQLASQLCSSLQTLQAFARSTFPNEDMAGRSEDDDSLSSECNADEPLLTLDCAQADNNMSKAVAHAAQPQILYGRQQSGADGAAVTDSMAAENAQLQQRLEQQQLELERVKDELQKYKLSRSQSREEWQIGARPANLQLDALASPQPAQPTNGEPAQVLVSATLVFLLSHVQRPSTKCSITCPSAHCAAIWAWLAPVC